MDLPVAKPIPPLSHEQIARILDTAWHAPDPLTAVLYQHGLSEGPLVQLLRREWTASAYKLWAQRVKLSGRKAPSRDGFFLGQPPKKAASKPAAKAKSRRHVP